ncbi:ABC transporter substrate-binding protein [Pararhodospirillum oryzae]|uniref:ABC transporter substrate-binding protein n=1 Tax=Pararhodospirillum oryzae TaxID=478448 RepID=A0A512H756_9PROT|nr:ABC transporter substrate-binding protein [Pararhodospirillum oryzae]GEO81289.1 hypothetical protein ROR02_14200 [Pararhodospirillum oryzae]
MSRKILHGVIGVLALLGGMLGLALADARGARAAEGAPYRIFMILFRGETEAERGFRDYLADHAMPAVITVRDLDHDLSRLPAVIAEAKALKPDLIYTWGTGIAQGVIGAYDQTDTSATIGDIPVLFDMVTSPVDARLVREMGPSGRNITGVSHIPPLESQIRAMQVYRTLTRLGIIYNPIEQNSASMVTKLRTLCDAQGIDLVAEPVPLDATGHPRADVLPDLVAKVAAREPQFLYIGPDTFIGENRDVLTREAMRHQIPVFTGTELEIRESNAMVGLVATYYALGKLAGYKAEQILVDKVPVGTIPVETLKRFSYIVKMSVARQLELYPPMALLDYAELIP